jgi:DNA-binding response OmpR family regulator
MSCRILIVDDEKDFAAVLKRYLENHGFSVTARHNSKNALESAHKSRPALVLTDAEMPGGDGFELCDKLKSSRTLGEVPVIIMSGKRTAETDQLRGYGRGADDYLIKPFSYPVMLAKVKAAIRRFKACEEKQALIEKMGLTINPSDRTVKAGKKDIKLTRKEFDLLTLLLMREGRLLSVPFLLETVWGYDPAEYNDPHTVESHISSLRRKLGPSVAHRIVKIVGHGYRIQ